MSTKKGFTLLETIICITIVAILAGITFAATRRSRQEATISTCLSNFHQYAVAIAMYREDWNGADSGNAYEMGLPTNPLQLTNGLNCPLKGLPNSETQVNLGYVYMVGTPLDLEGEKIWEQRIQRSGGHTTILGDLDHNDLDSEGKKLFPHRGIGLNLDGTAFVKIQAGMDMWETWWAPQGG